MTSLTITDCRAFLSRSAEAVSSSLLPKGITKLYSIAKVADCFTEVFHTFSESPRVVLSNVQILSKTCTDYYEGLSVLSDISFLLSPATGDTWIKHTGKTEYYSRLFGWTPLHMLGALSYCKKMGVISKIDIFNLGAIANRIGNISIMNSKPLQSLQTISSDHLSKLFLEIALVGSLTSDWKKLQQSNLSEVSKRSTSLNAIANTILLTTVMAPKSYQNTRVCKVICLVGAVCKFASIYLNERLIKGQ